MRRTTLILGVSLAAMTALAGCTAKAPADSSADVAGAAKALTVESSADACTVSAAEAKSGPVSFEIKNAGDRVTEFYLLAEDGLRIVGEKENILAGSSTQFTVNVEPGKYFTTCKPGMVGDGVGKAPFTVTGAATTAGSGSEDQQIQQAVTNYVSYVKDQAGALVTGTDEFVKAYTAGDDDKARALYPTVRAHYERIEPTAESFGDLDPKLDFREPDAKEAGLDWTGWHRTEKDLWPPAGFTASDPAGRKKIGDQLVADTKSLYDAVYADAFAKSLNIGAISNGSIGLLDEVASSKITGEEESFSHTDLWDFQANVEGASVAYGNVRDIAEAKGDQGKQLVTDIDAQFKKMNDMLSTYGSIDKGYTFYDDLSKDQIKELSDQVNALSEPLSQLTTTVLGIAAPKE